MTSTEDYLLHHRVSQFLFHEARMIDEQRWDEWQALFTEDGVYWAPATLDQPDPLEHVSLIYEDDLLRKVRIARFKSPAAYSLQPYPRSTHLVSNVIIDSSDGDELTVSSRFQMAEYRRDNPNVFIGAYVHDLIEKGDGFRIRQKKATLVNCDGVLPSASLYF